MTGRRSTRSVGSGLIAVLALMALPLLSACTSDPLAITCSEFLSKSSDEQLALAARWGAPDRNHVGPAEESVAPTYRKDLLGYCPQHPGDRLADLSLRIS